MTFATAGAESLTATCTPYAATANTTVSGAAPAGVTLSSPVSVPINSAFSTLTANVKDQFNNPISGAAVTFAAIPGGTGSGGTFSGGGVANTNASGDAVITVTANNKAGDFTVTATALSATSAPRTLTITNGAAASLSVIGGSTQSAALNSAFAAQLQVQALDSGGNAVPGFSVTFTSPSSGASCGYPAAASTAVTTDSAGKAAVICTANGTTGSYAVTASGAGWLR